MFRGLVTFFIVSSSIGCVTVTEPVANVDNKKAAVSRIELGFNYLESGNSSKAKQNFEKAMRLAPELATSHLAIAYYYQTVGELNKTHAAYLQGIASVQQQGDLLNNYGAFLCSLRRYDEALQYFKRAIAQPDYYQTAASYENAGLCALQAEDKNQAYEFFQRATEHQPLRYQATLQLAKLEIAQGDRANARLRLHRFHQRYGYQLNSITLLIELEKQDNNWSMVNKYEHLLERQLPVSQ
jgi:type IV pilus assembly protein PilF